MNSQHVVPANAGTHNHESLLMRRVGRKATNTVFPHNGRGVSGSPRASPGRKANSAGFPDFLPRHVLPELLQSRWPSSKRGRRESRVPTAPAVSCAKTAHSGAHEHTGSAETSRPSPRNGLTAYIVLSPASEFVLSPSPAGHFPQAWHQQRVSGPHDLAVRLRSVVCQTKASTASPAQRIVTIAKRPSCGPGCAEVIAVICPT